jgi:hypothetical protein
MGQDQAPKHLIHSLRLGLFVINACGRLTRECVASGPKNVVEESGKLVEPFRGDG